MDCLMLMEAANNFVAVFQAVANVPLVPMSGFDVVDVVNYIHGYPIPLECMQEFDPLEYPGHLFTVCYNGDAGPQ